MPGPRSLASVFLILACSGICACSTLTLTDFGKLERGMSVEAAHIALGKTPEDTWPLELSDAEHVRLERYKVTAGITQSDYYLAFVDNGLYYWGHPHEFARSSEPRVNEIGRAARAKRTTEQEASW